jgi:hypothetical protein
MLYVQYVHRKHNEIQYIIIALLYATAVKPSYVYLHRTYGYCVYQFHNVISTLEQDQ